MSHNITKLISDEDYDTANEFLGDLLSNKVSDFIEVMKVELASTMFAEATGTCPECMESNKECGCEEEDDDAEEIDEAMHKDEDPVDRPDVPFAGPYRDVSKPRKDQYGNIIKDKNAAKNLAKQGMAGVRKEEVEQMEESKFTASGPISSTSNWRHSTTSYNNHFHDKNEAEKTAKNLNNHTNDGNYSAIEHPDGRVGYRITHAYKTQSAVNRKIRDLGPILRREDYEQMDELNKGLGSILNRYITKATDDFGPRRGREEGVRRALQKKWGDKSYGFDEPKVKAVQRNEDYEQIDELSPGLLIRARDTAGSRAARIKTHMGSSPEHQAYKTQSDKFEAGAQKAASRDTKKSQDNFRNKFVSPAMQRKLAAQPKPQGGPPPPPPPHMKEEVEQMAEAFVIHKGKHEPGTKSSLEGTHHGVKVKPVYTDKKEAQAHANKINAGRGYKPGDEKSSLYGGVLYQVSPAKSQLNNKATPIEKSFSDKRYIGGAKVMAKEEAKWRSSSAAKPDPDNDWDRSSKSTGGMRATSDTRGNTGGEYDHSSLENRRKAQVASKGPNAGKTTKASNTSLKNRIRTNIADLKNQKTYGANLPEDYEHVNEAEMTDMQKLSALGMKGSEKARTMQALSTYRRKGDINKLSPGHRTLVAGYIEKTGGLGSVNRSAALSALKKDKMQEE